MGKTPLDCDAKKVARVGLPLNFFLDIVLILFSGPGSSAAPWPNMPTLPIRWALGFTRLPACRARLFWPCGLWCRFHFQKNSLMFGTFPPPEIYSNALSYIVITTDPTTGIPAASNKRTFTFARWPGLYRGVGILPKFFSAFPTFSQPGAAVLHFILSVCTSTFNTRLAGGTTICRQSVCTLPSAMATASTKKFGMSLMLTSMVSTVLLPVSLSIFGRRYTPPLGLRNNITVPPGLSVLMRRRTLSPGA